jgi:ketosteroid isomerase-like protein
MNTTPEILDTANRAFSAFRHGLATGEWDGFLETLADDFTFWFPVGPFQGENCGKERAREFFHYVTDKVFIGGLTLDLVRIASDENTVFFEARSSGTMLGHPYQNQVAIAFEIQGNLVHSYREYLGVAYRIGSD